MPARSFRRQLNEVPVRRSTRIARYNGLIDDVTEAVIMQLSPRKRRRWGPEGRPKLTGQRLDGRPIPRRQLATAAAALARCEARRRQVADEAIAAAQAAADAVKAAADAVDEAIDDYDSDATVDELAMYRYDAHINSYIVNHGSRDRPINIELYNTYAYLPDLPVGPPRYDE